MRARASVVSVSGARLSGCRPSGEDVFGEGVAQEAQCAGRDGHTHLARNKRKLISRLALERVFSMVPVVLGGLRLRRHLWAKRTAEAQEPSPIPQQTLLLGV